MNKRTLKFTCSLHVFIIFTDAQRLPSLASGKFSSLALNPFDWGSIWWLPIFIWLYCDSFIQFPFPGLGWAVSLKHSGFFSWEMVFREHNWDTRFYWVDHYSVNGSRKHNISIFTNIIETRGIFRKVWPASLSWIYHSP